MSTSATLRIDHPCDRSVFTVRRFLAEVAARARAAQWEADGATASTGDALVDDMPAAGFAPPALFSVWQHFVPTTIRLADPIEGKSYISEDVDGSNPAAFATGLKVVDRVRQRPLARIQQVAVRAYLAPPARHCEIAERAAYLRAAGHPLTLESRQSSARVVIFDRLTTRERRRLAFIPIDEVIALAAVLVSEWEPVVAFSPDGTWPRHPLVLEVAGRLNRLIQRRTLDEIPEQAHRRIRYVRYVPVKQTQ